ncbi:MAG: hypothetical protein M0R80_26830 [Proteobacteria bacterium]|nr:hypothetical protein [Pseudomonadota bacterium]
MSCSNGKRGGARAGSGPKKNAARAALGRSINQTIQGMPFDAACQIVQGFLLGDPKNALGLIENMILSEHRAEAKRLAEECARLLAPYPDLWGVSKEPGTDAAPAPRPTAAARKDETGRAAVLLRKIAGFVNRERASTVVNYAYAGQQLKPRGTVIEKEQRRLAAVGKIKQTAQEERAYWKLVFELDQKRRDGTLTPEDLERLRTLTPRNLAPD